MYIVWCFGIPAERKDYILSVTSRGEFSNLDHACHKTDTAGHIKNNASRNCDFGGNTFVNQNNEAVTRFHALQCTQQRFTEAVMLRTFNTVSHCRFSRTAKNRSK